MVVYSIQSVSRCWPPMRGGAAVIVGDPEILSGKNGDSSRVQKLRVCRLWRRRYWRLGWSGNNHFAGL